LATGDSLKTISFSYRLGHTTVYNIVIETCSIISQKLMPEVMAMPTMEIWKEIANEFWSTWNFPNCIGAIDGKHIVIQAPPKSGSQFFNYKKTFSVVLLALVDAQYNFIAVDIGSYGKNSDGGILAHSKFGKALDEGKLNIPDDTELPGTTNKAPFVIVGDEGFPLKRNLLRPFPGKQLDDDIKRIFNYRLSRARRCSENVFGILVQKFRIYNRRIQSKPENVDKIILATCVLHNFIKKNENTASNYKHSTEINNISTTTQVSTLENIPAQGGNATQQAFAVRDIYKTYFSSSAGSVSWQNLKI